MFVYFGSLLGCGPIVPRRGPSGTDGCPLEKLGGASALVRLFDPSVSIPPRGTRNPVVVVIVVFCFTLPLLYYWRVFRKAIITTQRSFGYPITLSNFSHNIYGLGFLFSRP